MMKRLFWIIVAIVILHACAHKGYTIRGELADADGVKLVLKILCVDSIDPVDIDR